MPAVKGMKVKEVKIALLSKSTGMSRSVEQSI
jgi:hypothetical protein